MSVGPLSQPPLLHNLGRFFEFQELAADVTTEKFEFATDLGASEEFWGGTSEGRQAIGAGEGGIKFLGCSTEFFRGFNSCGVDRGGGCAGMGG